MPQITVEYSQEVTEAFDRRAFALALHPMASALIDSAVSSFKTRFYAIDDAVLGDGAPSHAMVHVDFRLLSGRPEALKLQLGKAVLALARDHIRPVPGLDIQLTVEVRDLDRPNYHKAVLAIPPAT
ncbi:MAG: 5-carboxymethyl-2-hydroxymuconate isomerase [Magnetospirillum sp.]|nr:5-carboxymethyl-2-hydroxymuconate isomerase [Magnetospirillum sp.]